MNFENLSLENLESQGIFVKGVLRTLVFPHGYLKQWTTRQYILHLVPFLVVQQGVYLLSIVGEYAKTFLVESFPVPIPT